MAKSKLIYTDIDISRVPGILLQDNYWQKCIELALKSGSENQRYGAIIVRNDKIIGEGWNRLLGKNEPFPFKTSFLLHAEKAAMGNAILTNGEESLKGSILYVAGFFYKERKPLILRPVNSNTCIICTQYYPRFGLQGAFPKEWGWAIISGKQAYENALRSTKIIKARKISIRDYRLELSL